MQHLEVSGAVRHTHTHTHTHTHIYIYIYIYIIRRLKVNHNRLSNFHKDRKGPSAFVCVSLCFIFIVGTNVQGSHNASCDRLHSLGHETSPSGKLDQHRTLPGNSLSLVVNNNQFYPCDSTFKAHFPISPYSPSVNQASILITSFELLIFEYWQDFMCPPQNQQIFISPINEYEF